ncbi:MAG: hypothetical protein HRF45_10490 [Fimbriimonadia bacterium]|jgi:tetratricopeptide (TPR) repeat protein
MIAVVLSALVSVTWPTGTPAQSRDALNAVWDSLEWQLVKASDLAWHQGEYDMVARVGYIWIEVNPDNTEAFSTTGYILEAGLQNYDYAEQVYKRAVQAHPARWECKHDLTFFYYMRKRYAEGAMIGEQMLALKPMPTAYHLVAHCYERSGQLAKSIATWKRALEVDPKNDVAMMNLKRVEEMLEKEKAGGEP